MNLGYHRILNTRLAKQEYYDSFTKPILNGLRFNDQQIMPSTPAEAWDKVYHYIQYKLYYIINYII